MFFNKNAAQARRASPVGAREPLSPKFARLVRESIWFALVALLAYVALVLASYSPGDPAWSYSGDGTPIRNRGGAIGAWLADFLLYLLGLSAWWFVVAGVAIVIASFRRIAHPELESEHPRGLALAGFALVLVSSSAIESLRFWQASAKLPLVPGGALGDAIGSLLARAIGYNGATLLLVATFLGGFSLFTGVSWLKLMERIGAALEGGVAWIRRKREERLDRRIGEQATAEREAVVERTREAVVEREPVLVVPPPPPAPKSERVVKEKQRPLFTDMPDSPLPALSLLEDAPSGGELVPAETLEFTSRLIERKLADFGVAAKVLAAYPGPVITRYEIEPAVGVKGSQIVNLIRDLARALSVVSIRVVETIPGKSCMALELPNARRQVVKLVEILASQTYHDAPGRLTLALGKDIAGKPVVADLARMPHLMVAGTTGSGKSVAVNAMILSLLYKAEPRDVRLILIDPKMLELSVYEGIPHLLAPVVTDMKLAPNALHWCVGEMERRYRLMSQLGVRNLAGYNQKVADAKKAGKPIANPISLTPDAPEPLEEMPLVVVVVDELADLMMVTGKKIEELIARIAQKARAAGIHLILATQRPSVDVITGLIKANIPSRIAFQVASKVDSRTILDQMGAETLLGQGDMLYLPPGTGHPQRVHGAFVSDGEVHRVVEHLKAQGEPQYVEGLLEGGNGDGDAGVSVEGADPESDPMYDQAVVVVLKTRRPSISLVQRHLRIGYNRAARLIEQMERSGLVSPMQTNGNREVLAPAPKE
ncbi:MAG: DNA translocase FtsK 4TM domain-containing protein [Burkholderiales bacterium]|nr:DNA translocase FtsK 4TM domain-containing protein [Burkholderiales bacterium]